MKDNIKLTMVKLLNKSGFNYKKMKNILYFTNFFKKYSEVNEEKKFLQKFLKNFFEKKFFKLFKKFFFIFFISKNFISRNYNKYYENTNKFTISDFFENKVLNLNKSLMSVKFHLVGEKVNKIIIIFNII